MTDNLLQLLEHDTLANLAAVSIREVDRLQAENGRLWPVVLLAEEWLSLDATEEENASVLSEKMDELEDALKALRKTKGE